MTQKVAVKQLLSEHFALSLKEIEKLRATGHPNIIEYVSRERDQNFNYIAMELCDASLSDYVLGTRSEELRKKLSEKNALKQALDGIAFLHKSEIIHGNIKPQNILIKVSQDGESVAVISDYSIKNLNRLVQYSEVESFEVNILIANPNIYVV